MALLCYTRLISLRAESCPDFSRKGDAPCTWFPSFNSCTFNRPKEGIRNTVGLATSHILPTQMHQLQAKAD